MSTPIRIALAIAAMLTYPTDALADAAPPVNPPGSSVLPQGETMVQMIAEAVTISVGETAALDSPVTVTAVFSLRNQGEATETMQVRFPLENPNGMGDGWGEHPLISNFSARVGGVHVRVSHALEPLGDNPPIHWATFPVSFPPRTDVLLEVSYDLALSESVGGLDQAQVEYILETGAGWFGTIESAVFTFRLPFAASSSNVQIADPWNPETVPPPVFVGREVRWEWSDFEPSRFDNLRIVFVWPSTWQDILALESRTGEDPSDVRLAVELAEAYRNAGSERHGFAVSEPLYRLALQAAQIGLAYRPSSPELLWERFTIQAWKCTSFPPCDDHALDRLVSDYRNLPPHPGQAPPEDLQWIIQRLEQDASVVLAASPQPTRSPATARPTKTHIDLEPEILPAATDSLTFPSATSTTTTAATFRPGSFATPAVLTVMAAGALLTILVFALVRRPRKG